MFFRIIIKKIYDPIKKQFYTPYFPCLETIRLLYETIFHRTHDLKVTSVVQVARIALYYNSTIIPLHKITTVSVFNGSKGFIAPFSPRAVWQTRQRLLIAWLLIFARVRFEAARRWWQPGLHSPLERIKDNRVKLARGSTMFGASCSSTRSILITVASAFSRICPGLA